MEQGSREKRRVIAVCGVQQGWLPFPCCAAFPRNLIRRYYAWEDRSVSVSNDVDDDNSSCVRREDLSRLPVVTRLVRARVADTVDEAVDYHHHRAPASRDVIALHARKHGHVTYFR